MKPLAFAIALVLLAAIGFATGVAGALVDGRVQAALQGLVDANPCAAVALYCAATAVGCVAFALPGALFAIVAAALFGPVAGTLWCSLAATAGAVLSFIAGRFFLRDVVKPRALRNRFIRRWLFSGSRRNELLTLAVTRLVPLFPFNLQNFAYGVTDMPLSTYALGTFVFVVPGTALYAFGAAGLFDEESRAPYLAVAAALLAILVIAGAVLRQRVGEAPDDDAEGRAHG